VAAIILILSLCSKRQIKKPKPIPLEEVESILKKEKEEQEKADKEFEDLENWDSVESFSKPVEDSELMLINKIKKQVKKSTSKGASTLNPYTPGASVHVHSGPFAGFSGSLLEVNRKNKKVSVLKALNRTDSIFKLINFSSQNFWLSKKPYLPQVTVQTTLFGKESFVDLDFEQIEAVNT
jgi:transcription antitermination factor NusG